GSVATLAGEWVVKANQVGRAIALIVFALLGISLLIPRIAEWLARPAVRFGAALQRRGDGEESVASSLLLGVSTGFLWAPCAGPILGLILASAAVQGPGAHSALLLLSFATGAAAALALALLAGG